MEIWVVVVGVMLVAALVAAAGGFRSRGVRRTAVVERPVRRRVVEQPVTEVVERRVD